MLNETFTLANGVKIPKIGLGTWLTSDEQAKQAVIDAVKLGYRHIDTAQGYENETGVGEGIRECGVPREELFITTKVMADHKDYASAAASVDESLKKLGVSYIDLILIHSPQPWDEFRDENRYFEENKQVWKALEDAYKAGKTRAIGVSNFLVDDMENILASCEIKPMVNQFLCHAGNTPFAVIDFCRKNGILVEAYSPIGHGAVLKNEKIKEIADKYNVSVAQLCLRYDLQLGLVILPKTLNPEHMKNNADLNFEILEEDMNVLRNLEKTKDYGEHGFFHIYARS